MDLCPPMPVALLLAFTNVFIKIRKCAPATAFLPGAVPCGTPAHHFHTLRKTAPHHMAACCSFLWNSAPWCWPETGIHMSQIRALHWRLSTFVITGILGSSPHPSCCFSPSDSGFQKPPSHLYFPILLPFLLIPCRSAKNTVGSLVTFPYRHVIVSHSKFPFPHAPAQLKFPVQFWKLVLVFVCGKGLFMGLLNLGLYGVFHGWQPSSARPFDAEKFATWQ